MRFNSIDKDNEKKKDISQYIIGAIFLAFFCYLTLNTLSKILIIIIKLAYNHWLITSTLIVIIIIIKKRGNKK